MSLGSALATAMSGLRANQAALSIVSSNVANAQTPGYVSESVNQVEVATGDTGASVSVIGINRQLNQFVQAQLRSETSGGAYADQMANVLTQLQSVYGTPGSAGSLGAADSAARRRAGCLRGPFRHPGATAPTLHRSASTHRARECLLAHWHSCGASASNGFW